MTPRESIIAVLGNNYLQHFLSTGMLGNGFAVLSDKRVYLRGKCLSKVGKHYRASREERVVDLNDVTGSGFEKVSQLHWLVLCIVFGVLTLLITILGFTGAFGSGNSAASNVFSIIDILSFLLIWVFLVLYLVKKKTIFKIEYSGGAFGFNLNLVPYNESDNFNRALRTAKDTSMKVSQQAVFTSVNQIQTPTYGAAAVSTADALRQYNDLLSQGIITQEDYEAKKRQLLGL